MNNGVSTWQGEFNEYARYAIILSITKEFFDLFIVARSKLVENCNIKISPQCSIVYINIQKHFN